MSVPSPVVRAVDLGYGHVKFSLGRSGDAIQTDSFPSASPVASHGVIDSPVMRRRDTFLVPFNDRVYEVGKDIAMAMSGNEESEVLDQDFAFSDAYRVRLYGALNYMLPTLPKPAVIDCLVLGLPLNTFFKRQKEVSDIFVGKHVINTKGDTVEVRACQTFPQPLGGFIEFLTTREKGSVSETLIVDPGYNTVDFFVCQGMQANEKPSSALNRGVSAVLHAAASAYIEQKKIDSSPSEIIRIADRSLSSGAPFRMFDKPIEMAEFLKPGRVVVEAATQAIKNFVGSATSIDVVVLSDGGAPLYEDAVRQKFPDHEVVMLGHSGKANVRGFHILGERLAASVQRAKAAA